MNFEKVVFGFFIVLAATLNLGFFVGDPTDAAQHNSYQLFAAIVVSIIATILKFGDRTQLGAVHLATSLVADAELIVAGFVWVWAAHISSSGMTPDHVSLIVSISGGALLANLISVIFLVTETLTIRR